ncbi:MULTISPECIES: hypothetical protein [Microbacterium]|uniref:hypothetical protein n=1 Tax=Microbacterium TaxID=33882 RepID=UPI00344E3277
MEVDTTPVDEDRAVLIWWTEIWENGNNAESSLSGVLGDIEGDDILWYDGVTNQTSYRGAVEAPFARFRC